MHTVTETANPKKEFASLDPPDPVSIDDLTVQFDGFGQHENIHMVLGRLLPDVGLLEDGVLGPEREMHAAHPLEGADVAGLGLN